MKKETWGEKITLWEIIKTHVGGFFYRIELAVSPRAREDYERLCL